MILSYNVVAVEKKEKVVELEALKEYLKLNTKSLGFIDFLKKGAQKANQANIPELYSKERFERVQKLLDKIRTNPS